MASRIANKIQKFTPIDKAQLEITSFLRPTHSSKPSTKPILNQLYSDNFNLVDRFNNYISRVSYLPKISSTDLRLFIGLIELAIVNSWVIWRDWTNEKNVDVDVQSFAIDLSRSLDTHTL